MYPAIEIEKVVIEARFIVPVIVKLSFLILRFKMLHISYFIKLNLVSRL